tara:strand:- start:1227 stop:1631 length:405 start_codon:yes stop_codon:yes gene_type:complete
MKHILKTITTLFIVSLTLTSCSKDDNSTTQDSIIGQWIAKEQLDNGEKILPTDCDKKTELNFKADGSLDATFAYDNDGECITGSVNGTWVSKGGNKYSYTLKDSEDEETYNLTLANDEITIDLEGGLYSIFSRK